MDALEFCQKILEQVDTDVELSTITDDVMGEKALTWTNMAIADVFTASEQWSWREGRTTLTTVVGQSDYTLAATIDPDTIESLVRTSDKYPLTYLDHEEYYEQAYQLAQYTGDSQYYTVIEQKIVLIPTPTTVTSYTYTYQKNPDVLTADDSTTIIPVKWHHILLQGALAYAKLYLGDPDSGAQFKIFSDGVKRMLASNRRYGGRSPGMQPG